MFGISAFSFLGCKDKTPEPEPTPVPPTEGLVAYYPFNGNALDESPFANNGSTNGVQFVRNRKDEESKAVYFDGIDDYIEAPHSGAINFGVDQDFTISLWAKYGDQNWVSWDNNDLLSKWEGGYPFVVRTHNQTYTVTPGDWHAGRWDGTCQNSGGAGGLNIGDDLYHHVVFQKKGTLLFGYTDGQQTSQGQDNTICETKNEAPLFIGARTAINGFFTGAIDDLRIYNRALSEAEIKILFEE